MTRLKNIFNGTDRTKLLVKNVLTSFFIKGWSAVVVLIMVPLTLTCLGEYRNGVWLTISSLLVWIDQMDIGLGNGLRNNLATQLALDNKKEARRLVSSTMAMLVCIAIPIAFILTSLLYLTDVYAFLNVDPLLLPELRAALLAAVILILVTFVLKFIGNVYMALQLPAISNLLMAIGQTLALLLTAALLYAGKATFFNIVVANVAAPLLTYLFAYPYTFFSRYPYLRPTLSMVNLRSALQLCNLGLKFFWIQIASLIQFMTANLLISQFYSPAMVTPYQIAYRYMSIVMVAFTVICMPFWSATTDAWQRGDMVWIAKADRRMSAMTAGLGILLAIMTAVSQWVYQLWIGDACRVPFGITAMMALYIYLLVLSMRYSYFLNGIGALRLQLYMTVFTVIFIPLAWFVCSNTDNIVWFMAVMCLCIAPSILVNMIQFRKVIKGTAAGLWRI